MSKPAETVTFETIAKSLDQAETLAKEITRALRTRDSTTGAPDTLGDKAQRIATYLHWLASVLSIAGPEIPVSAMAAISKAAPDPNTTHHKNLGCPPPLVELSGPH